MISQRADSSVLRELGIKSRYNFKNLLTELQQLGDEGDAIPVVKDLKRYILIFLQVQDELDNYEEYRKEAKIEKKSRDVEDKIGKVGQWKTAFVAEINRRDLPHRNQKANLAEQEGDFGDDDRRDVRGRF